ncbi:MAG: hypothetical protein V3S43_06155 [Acidimicrobiia bacterium]
MNVPRDGAETLRRLATAMDKADTPAECVRVLAGGNINDLREVATFLDGQRKREIMEIQRNATRDRMSLSTFIAAAVVTVRKHHEKVHVGVSIEYDDHATGTRVCKYKIWIGKPIKEWFTGNSPQGALAAVREGLGEEAPPNIHAIGDITLEESEADAVEAAADDAMAGGEDKP